MKLLIVEDNPDQITSYQDIINEINSEGEEQIEHTILNTLPLALDALKKDQFDAAIVDLRLSGGENSAEGNEVLKEIVNIRRFPVFVYSSHLGDVDTTFTTSVFFQKFERTSIAFKDLVKKLQDIYKTGITKILGKNGIIEENLTNIFWNHIADSFEDLSSRGVTQGQLLRYIAGHLYEYLELNGTDFDKYLPEEVYIRPSIKPEFFTGSIIKEKNADNYYIVLTPQCDMAQKKAKTILAAEIVDGQMITEWKLKLQTPLPGGPNNKAKRKLREEKIEAQNMLTSIINNTYSHRYYFLPKSKAFKGGLINFQRLIPVKDTDIANDYDRVATVNSHFLKDIVAKFAFYYSRQGAPDLNYSIEELIR